MEVPSIFLNRVLADTAKKRAVSLHFTVGSQPVWRVAKELQPVADTDIVTLDLIQKILGIVLDEQELAKFNQARELVVVKKIADAFRFRINVFFQKNLPSITFYYIPDVIANFASLNLPSVLNQVAAAKSGLLVISGTYSSGKTTTSASIIEQINQTQKKRIVTIENPIEYSFVSKQSIVEQRQVGRDTPSFADGLRYCLEEDVDVVYIGETRDDLGKVIPLILEISAGNTLVILELNAGNSASAIERILTEAIAKSDEAIRHGLADTLVAVIVQKLLARRGGGMIPAVEVLIGNTSVKSLIREGKVYQLESVIQTSRKDGMVNMEKSIDDLAVAGEIKTDDQSLLNAQ